MNKRVKSVVAAAMAVIMLISWPDIKAVKADSATGDDNQVTDMDWTQAPPLLVTEVVADNPSGKRYTYTEIYNNSDKAINFSDYIYYYCYTGGMGSEKYSEMNQRYRINLKICMSEITAQKMYISSPAVRLYYGRMRKPSKTGVYFG